MTWLTIKEATTTTGKAEITIRRLIQRIQPTKQAKKIKGKWHLSGKVLLDHNLITDDHNEQVNDQPLISDYIATLKAELKEKNEQIHRLMDQADHNQEMQRTMALLLNGYRRQLGISIDQVVEDVEEVPPLDKSQARSFGDWISATKN